MLRSNCLIFLTQKGSVMSYLLPKVLFIPMPHICNGSCATKKKTALPHLAHLNRMGNLRFLPTFHIYIFKVTSSPLPPPLPLTGWPSWTPIPLRQCNSLWTGWVDGGGGGVITQTQLSHSQLVGSNPNTTTTTTSSSGRKIYWPAERKRTPPKAK